jgi:prepilin-type N-terminal cleavage/methylation domain-containing protein/prepilin-type processing-associated H-X9-DG protein
MRAAVTTAPRRPCAQGEGKTPPFSTQDPCFSAPKTTTITGYPLLLPCRHFIRLDNLPAFAILDIDFSERANPKPMKNPNPRSRPAFTLVELLVVIVIIATLLGLSLMGFRKIREAGDRASVISVLRQLQVANVGYAADHNGQYVPLSSMDENENRINDWHQSSVFLAYLTGDNTALEQGRKTVDAPVSVLDPIVVRAKKRLWNKLFASYGYNSVGMPALKPNTDRSFKVSQVTNPSRTACFLTATDWIVSYNSRFNWLKDPVEGKSTDQRIAFRHGGKAVVVYYDGSTGMVSPADLRTIDQQGGANHPFWKANAN